MLQREFPRLKPPRLLPRRVGIQLSQVEVRFEDLNIESDVFVGSRALPSVTNEFLNYAQACITCTPSACVMNATCVWTQSCKLAATVFMILA